MHEFIQCSCRTNLDEYRHENWPTMFAAVPRKGDRVAAASGRSLHVVSITYQHSGGVEIELHR